MSPPAREALRTPGSVACDEAGSATLATADEEALVDMVLSATQPRIPPSVHSANNLFDPSGLDDFGRSKLMLGSLRLADGSRRPFRRAWRPGHVVP